MKLKSPSPAGRALKREIKICNAWKVQAGIITPAQLRRWAKNAARWASLPEQAKQARGLRSFF